MKRILFFAFLYLPSFVFRVSAAESKPNILLIVADDVGYGDLSCYGNQDIATPHMDAIANNGIRFNSGYVMAPVCGPSRAAILSGRYPGHVLPYAGNPPPGSEDGLPREHPLLSDFLRQGGYRTAALGKWHLGEAPGFEPQARGFDRFFGFLSGMHDYFHAEDKRWGPVLRGHEKTGIEDYLTFELAREAVSIIADPADEPFFLYLAFNATHTPLQAPPRYLEKTAHLSPPVRQKNQAMLLALDDAIGLVTDALRDSGQEDRTLIAFLSDNGAALVQNSAENGGSNAPLRGSKVQCWEGGIRVPFLLQWKQRVPAGRVNDDPVCTLDLLPTLLAAADVPTPAKQRLDGVNLLPWLEGKAEFPRREPLCWKMWADNFAIRDGDMKLVRVGSERGLFNVRIDPGEKNDLEAKHSALAEHLEARWKRWDELSLRKTPAPKPAGQRTGATPPPEPNQEQETGAGLAELPKRYAMHRGEPGSSPAHRRHGRPHGGLHERSPQARIRPEPLRRHRSRPLAAEGEARRRDRQRETLGEPPRPGRTSGDPGRREIRRGHLVQERTPRQRNRLLRQCLPLFHLSDGPGPPPAFLQRPHLVRRCRLDPLPGMEPLHESGAPSHQIALPLTPSGAENSPFPA